MALAREKFEKLVSVYRAGDYAHAAAQTAAALRASPKDPNLLHLAAQVAEAQGDGARAVMFYRRALAANPGWLEARFNLAMALHAQGETAEAIDLMSAIGREKPSLPYAWESLAKFHQTSGDLPAAAGFWEKALMLAPEQHEWRAQLLLLRRQMCDWKEPASVIATLSPQAATVFSDDPALQKEVAERYAKKKFGAVKPFPFSARKVHERLRVGYLSSDFHEHATAYLLAELFEIHDRERFEVFVYSYGVDDRSAIRSRIYKSSEHFIELSALSAPQASARIRDDEIDILVDLKGYTRGSRPDILAFRPAPVQVHWLGYPGTLGADFIDYFIADSVTVPEGHEQFFTERVARMPHCYQINDRQRAIGPFLPRAAYGLPDEAFVLASFNQTYKITPEMFGLWCDILREQAHSVLWLYRSNAYAPDVLRQEAQRRGVDPAQLVFATPLPLDQHLARYAHVALALDTHPVGGHTTTSDALWAGVPVVTLGGQSFVSRVAGSLLSAAGLSFCVTATMAAYKELVLKLMREKDRLQHIHDDLKARRLSLPLFDTFRFVADWEALLSSLRAEKYRQA